MMIYGGLQAKLMGTKHKGHIHRCGIAIFDNIVMKSLKSGRTLCFQFIFTAVSTFASHFKTVLNLRFLEQIKV